jgi:chaperonin GroES
MSEATQQDIIEILRPRPIKDQVLIRQDQAETLVGKERRIIAPQGSEEWPSFGTVVAVGPGIIDGDGRRQEIPLKVGDRVLFKRKPESALNQDERIGARPEWHDLLMLRESYILAVVEE